jgi:ribosomal 50S subunit-recycling heat shock protein
VSTVLPPIERVKVHVHVNGTNRHACCNVHITDRMVVTSRATQQVVAIYAVTDRARDGSYAIEDANGLPAAVRLAAPG